MSRQRDSDVPLLKGSIIRKRISKVKSVFIDISFPDPSGPKPTSIFFQNHYCSSLSIYQQVSADDFIPILESYQLMKDPHIETDSQNLHEIQCTTFNANYTPWKTLRFYLFQPDPMWLKYEIMHIRVSSADKNNSFASNYLGEERLGCSILGTIASDWEKLVQAGNNQQATRHQPEIGYTLAEYRKMLKKKEKKKDKKGAATQLAVTNDEFGISIPDFSKNEDIP